MTNYNHAGVKAAVLAAIEAIHGAGISLVDKANALTILAEIATQMKDDHEVNTRDWQSIVSEWGD